MNRMDERDMLKDLDWSKVYTEVPDSVSAGVQYAFMRIRRREKQRRMILRVSAAAACVAFAAALGGFMFRGSGDSPDLVASPEMELRVLAMGDRVYAARADDYFHIHAACPSAMAEQVELQLVTALEFDKQKCGVCGANVLLP